MEICSEDIFDPLHSPMKNRTPSLLLMCCIVTAAYFLPLPPALRAADQQPANTNGAAVAQYKVISGFKQPFKDALQFETSSGWTPVGGVSVTTWNNNLYFAQLLSKSAAPQ